MTTILDGLADRDYIAVSTFALASEKRLPSKGLSDCDGDCGGGDCDCSGDCDD